MRFTIEIERASGAVETYQAATMLRAYAIARLAARNGADFAGVFTTGTAALWVSFEAA